MIPLLKKITTHIIDFMIIRSIPPSLKKNMFLSMITSPCLRLKSLFLDGETSCFLVKSCNKSPLQMMVKHLHNFSEPMFFQVKHHKLRVFFYNIFSHSSQVFCKITRFSSEKNRPWPSAGAPRPRWRRRWVSSSSPNSLGKSCCHRWFYIYICICNISIRKYRYNYNHYRLDDCLLFIV